MSEPNDHAPITVSFSRSYSVGPGFGAPIYVVDGVPLSEAQWIEYRAETRAKAMQDAIDGLVANITPSKKFWTTGEVAEHAGLSVSSIERLKAAAEARGISKPPWTHAGRRLMWHAGMVDDFLMEAKRWRSFKREAGSSSSAGAQPQGSSAGARARAARPQTRSNSTSNRPQPRARLGACEYGPRS